MIRNISIVFAAGCVGGLLKSLMVAFMGASGLFEAFGIKFSPVSDPGLFYQRVISGGIYGFLLLIPLLARRPVWRGLAFSLLPTVLEWSMLYPFQSSGMLGQDAGLATPMMMLVINGFWGIAASYWLKISREETVPAARRRSQQKLHYRGRAIIH